ncbi:MAG: efflux transporter outer membrane subunit [Bacteroidota bacterium]
MKQILLLLTSFALLIVLLAGCSSQKNTVDVLDEELPEFTESGTEPVIPKWWQAFDDQHLNRLVDKALEDNFDLKIAWQRLQASEAEARAASASFFPVIDASASGQTSKGGNTFSYRDNYSTDLAASYEIDLWGKIAAQSRAAGFYSEAAQKNYQTAAITLAAEITRTWYQLQETELQADILEQQIETNRNVLELLKTRFGSGQVRSVDIMRQEQLLERTKEQQISLQQQRALLKSRLNVLSGQPPQENHEYDISDLPDLPPKPKTGLPAELIQRRPDVQNAFLELKAADEELAVAISSRYPRVSLNASIGAASDDVGSLFDNFVRSFAGNLLAPLFYGGELKAQQDRAEAYRKEKAYEYGQTVLSAFEDVENALVQENQQLETLESIQRQVELAEKTYEQLKTEYFNGMSNYLDVLTALDELQQLRRNYLQGRFELIDYRIALYRSLAGSFETERENAN